MSSDDQQDGLDPAASDTEITIHESAFPYVFERIREKEREQVAALLENMVCDESRVLFVCRNCRKDAINHLGIADSARTMKLVRKLQRNGYTTYHGNYLIPSKKGIEHLIDQEMIDPDILETEKPVRKS